MPEAVIRRALEAIPGARFRQAYGQTEAAPVLTFLEPERHVFEGPCAGKIKSAGQAAPGVELAILDAEDREVPRGEVGEICARGENVYSAEVENAIRQHPAVAECAVIGIPHAKWGEQAHAIVRLKADATLDAEALMAFCRELIAGYKCPRSVAFATEPSPLSGAGKILKAELRKPYWEGYERQVN